MINVAETLACMNASDVRVTLDGDGLRVIAPAGTMTEDRVAFMRQHRNAIIEFLRAAERDRVRVLNLRSTPDLDEFDNAEAAEGRSIIKAIEAVGGWIRIENGRIVLRWRHDVMPGALIDRILANRTGIVTALGNEDLAYDTLERDAIQNEADSDNAGSLSNQTEKSKSMPSVDATPTP